MSKVFLVELRDVECLAVEKAANRWHQVVEISASRMRPGVFYLHVTPEDAGDLVDMCRLYGLEELADEIEALAQELVV